MGAGCVGVGGRSVGAWVGVGFGRGDKKYKISKKIGLPVRNLIKKTHFLKVEVGFFFDKKSFSQIFQNSAKLYHLRFI